ncbi:MAG: hypothetical protein JST00_39770 [Deltaproteobacteria bacterium]|nr:hypothetical protein [Deltaproteobacteria bacterium]
MRALLALVDHVARIFDSRGAIHAFVVAMLLVPLAFGSPLSPGPWHLGAPRVASGDEPHYLVYLHSILEDGDLDLENNYVSVHRGSDQAGLLATGGALNHHAVWFVGERRVFWYEIFGAWGKDAEGHPMPLPKEGVDPALLPKVERPWNSPGLPLLLAPLFLPVRGTSLYEHLAVVLSALAVIGATFFWRMLAERLSTDRRVVNAALVLAFLGTPVWHYARSFFSEPYLVFLVTGAYALAFARQRFVIAGVFAGMTVFIKPIAGLMVVPIGVMLLADERRRRDALRFAVPVGAFVLANLATNTMLYGGPLHSSNKWSWGPFVQSALQMLAHPTRGLLSTAPIVLLAAAGWPEATQRVRDMRAVVAGCALFFAAIAAYSGWAGGFAYSIRFLVPLMPLFCLGLVPLLGSSFKRFVMAAGALSICINALAAIQYWRAFHQHPFLYFVTATEL